MKTNLFFLAAAALCLSSCATDSVPESTARSLRPAGEAVGSHRFNSVHSYTWEKSAGPAYSNAADFYQPRE